MRITVFPDATPAWLCDRVHSLILFSYPCLSLTSSFPAPLPAADIRRRRRFPSHIPYPISAVLLFFLCLLNRHIHSFTHRPPFPRTGRPNVLPHRCERHLLPPAPPSAARPAERRPPRGGQGLHDGVQLLLRGVRGARE